MKKKKRVTIIMSLVFLALIISGGIYAYTEHISNKNVEKAKEYLSENYKEIETVQVELESLKEDSFLRKGLTAQDINKVEEHINSIKSSSSDYNLKKGDLEDEIAELSTNKDSLKKELSSINNQFKTQEAINALFNQETLAIDGKDVNSDVVIKESIEATTIAELKETSLVEDEKNTDWQIAINTLIIEAETQLSKIETATSKVEELVKDGNVQSGVSIDAYNQVKSEVDTVKNENVKKELSDKLVKVYDQVRDISKLSEKEVARRSLALFMQLYEEGNTDSTYNTSIFSFDNYKGGIQYMYVEGMNVDARIRGSYSITQNGNVTFYDGVPGGAMEISESKTANIFTDINETLLNSIRIDVTDLDSSIWAEVEKKKQEFEQSFSDNSDESLFESSYEGLPFDQ